jgi:hypothetical protein
MSLGILLAASWLELFSPAEIVAKISQSLDFSASDQAEALGLITSSGNFFALVGALPLAVLLSADQSEIERAVELYALAPRHPYVANSHWFEDVAGRHIAAVAERLPPEVVAAAQERGKARDLWATAGELLAELGG